MIDIHCHILPNLDDGARSMDESVAMARLAAADGISRIVATPHVNGKGSGLGGGRLVEGARFAGPVAAVNRRLHYENIPVTVLPGAEIASNTAVAGDLSGLGMNDTRFLLIELPHTHLPANAAALIFRLITGGYWPIVAHPERNPSIIDHPQKLMALRRQGALVQITAGSLIDGSDPDIRHCARYLLKKGAVDFIASDAHSSTTRPPKLSAAYDAACGWIGSAGADDLCHNHPLALVKGIAIYGAR